MIPADWSAADAEELHELRKRVVIHRYQMDIVRPLWPRFAKMWTRRGATAARAAGQAPGPR